MRNKKYHKQINKYNINLGKKLIIYSEQEQKQSKFRSGVCNAISQHLNHTFRLDTSSVLSKWVKNTMILPY